jgi:hypothetical protein
MIPGREGFGDHASRIARSLQREEEAQIPNGVLELRFLKQDEVFDSIHPHGKFAPGSPQVLGYQIAEETCLRCHNTDSYGGHKAGKSWSTLGRAAQINPTAFARYIKDPQSVNAFAQMPGFAGYDDATLLALTAYFQSVVSEEKLKRPSQQPQPEKSLENR